MTSNIEPSSANLETGPLLLSDVPSRTRFRHVDHVAETGSTNADLLAQAGRSGGTVQRRLRAGGEPEAAEPEPATIPRVLYTDHQRAGRGRQDRRWYDHPGDSLLVSVLVGIETGSAALLPAVTGLAATDAVGRISAEEGVDAPAPALKWPNDVVVPSLDDRKLAGILVETVTSVDGSTMVAVIGMGMNLRWSRPPPDEVVHRAVTVSELVGSGHGSLSGPGADAGAWRDRLLAHYLVALDHRLDGLGHPSGLVDAYRRRCVTVGRRVRFESGSGEIAGQAVDVGDDGSLVVVTDDGRRRQLWAGDVHHIA